MRKLLISRESECVQPIRALIEAQKHRTLVLWSIDCAGRVLAIFEERHPEDPRPREALDAARAWARGSIKMPIAKKAAHATHNAATAVESDPPACAAARAMGHVVGTVHVETHALGLVFYGITAFVYAEPQKDADGIITRELDWFFERLLYWQEAIDMVDQPWATFLLRDDIANKEKLLHQK